MRQWPLGIGKKIAAAGLATSLLAASSVVCAQIPCSYDVQIIASSNDCGGFGTVNTFGLGLNENGAVVGYYFCPLWDHDEAFVWTARGGFVTLDRPAGVSSAIAVDINDNGVICGTVFVSGLDNRGFVYENGVWTILPPVVDVPGARCSAEAINNVGAVVGQRSITEDISPQNAYIWSAEKGFTDLGVIKGPNSFGSSISETGIVVGWTGNQTGSIANAFIWQDRRLTLLGHVPGGFTSQATAVTDDGVVVGRGRIPLKGSPVGAPRAFLWVDGVFEMLGVLPNHDWSTAADIRSQPRQIVGSSWNVDGNPGISHPFIWQDGLMQNINDLIDPDLGLVLRSAASMGKTGQIVANGDDPTPNAVAFVLTPTAAPLGDLDGDCIIGAIDLLMLLTAWGRCADCGDCGADLDNNCVVGASDLLILLVNWGSK